MKRPTEQDFAEIRTLLPRFWRNLYQGCLEEGFDERQAFALTQTYILAQNPYGIQPPDKSGPQSDLPE